MSTSGSLAWRKPSRSHEDGDACVEIAAIANTVAIRDSKHPDGSKLLIDRGDFRNFASVLKSS
ncbi:DUF397 domain-containing protein [Actinomadura sp. 7K534]|nr:DUF397 domain-containing protein [Actinomadura sp. 7K534]TDB92833.1 DUF397 domain-containing protein [Actinomadura sp. 7K534]